MTEPEPQQPLECLLCRCDCGCQNDGEWHFTEPVGCRCVSLGCPCVEDAPDEPIIVFKSHRHSDGRECDLIRPNTYIWRVRYCETRTGMRAVCRRSHIDP